MNRVFLLLCLPIFLVPGDCWGQGRSCLPATIFSWSGERSPLGELDSIATDRPDFTEASSTVGMGVTQLEMGYTFASASGAASHSWGEPLLRQGLLANWFELRFAAAPVSVFGTGSESGFEDIYVGLKLALTQQAGILPEVAIVPQMTVPTGGSAFSADRTLGGANLLYGWDITDEFSFGGSTQFNQSVDDALVPYDEWAQSLTVGRSLTEKLASFLEWYALVPVDSAGVQTSHYLNGGFTYVLSADVQLDIRAGKGLSDTSDDYFIGAGVSFRHK